ncbi:hypothetical protein NL676_006557 [Syzygium grande]|nr:hypothetical protein NL676_006557 [Syzygium grande]
MASYRSQATAAASGEEATQAKESERNREGRVLEAVSIVLKIDLCTQASLFCTMSDDDEDRHDFYQSDYEARHLPLENDTDSQANLHGLGNTAGSYEVDLHREQVETEGSSVSPLHESFDSQGSNEVQQLDKKDDEHLISDECEVESLYPAEDVASEPVDFENNGLLWLPPEPEDEKEGLLFDDADVEGDAAGEWGYLHTSGSFGSAVVCCRAEVERERTQRWSKREGSGKV